MDNPRKATDVILDLETKIDTALSTIKMLDLNIKIISNKLNVVLAALEKITLEPTATIKPITSKFSVEAANVATSNASKPQETMFFPEENLSVDNSPKGFRRTSRPETFSGDDMYLPSQPKEDEKKLSVQTVKVPKDAFQTEVKSVKTQNIVQNAIPVMQRIVDKTGKSIYLADVELIDTSNMQSVFKTRTSANGKWSAPLIAGHYKVMIRKGASSNKDKIEVGQDIHIDGSSSPMELSTLIIK